jgi:hypothetical protein
MNLVRNTYRANLIGHWHLNDPSGTVAHDASSQMNNGAYTACTLGQTGMGDGHGAASFDGSTSFCNIYSTALNADFNGAEGSFCIWFKVANAGVWTDGVGRYIMHLAASLTTDFIRILKTTTNNRIELTYLAGSVTEVYNLAISSVDWNHIGMTWSKAAEQVKYYLNGTLLETDVTLGVWAGALRTINTALGARATTPSSVWSGYLAHASLWTTPLPAQAILRLARA